MMKFKKKLLSLIMSFMILIVSVLPFTALTVFAFDSIQILDSSSNVVLEVPVDTVNVTEPLKQSLQFCALNASPQNVLTIKMPAGEYVITKTNTATSNTVLDLTNGTIIRNDCPGRGNIINSPSGYYGYDGLYNFTLRGGELSYTDNNVNESTLSRIAHANGVRFENVKFTDGFISHFVEVAGSTNVVFDRCVFDGFTGDLSTSSCEAIQIDILEEDEHFSGFPFYDGTMNNGVTVENCVFNNLVSGVGTKSMFHGYYQNNITIRNNIFSNLTGCAIFCTAYINTDIYGNTITNCGEGINYFMMRPDSRLRSVCDFDALGSVNKDCKTRIFNNNISVNSTIDVSTASAIYIFGNNVTSAKKKKYDSYAKVANYAVNKISVYSNTITTTGHGIRMYDTVNSKIHNNTVSSTRTNGGYGVYLANSSNSNDIYSNTISQFSNSVLIASSSAKNKITNNTVSSAGSSGIVVNTGCNNNLISSNIISNSEKNGILIGKCSGTNIQRNNIVSSGADGIHVNSKANVSAITSNTLNDSGKYAIYFEKDAIGNVYLNNYKNCSARYGYSKGEKKDYKFANLAVPAVKPIKKSGRTVTLSWKKVGGASVYYVYRSTSKKGTYSYVGSTKKTSFKNSKLKKGKKYYYKVSAVKVGNGVKARSNLSSYRGKKI